MSRELWSIHVSAISLKTTLGTSLNSREFKVDFSDLVDFIADGERQNLVMNDVLRSISVSLNIQSSKDLRKANLDRVKCFLIFLLDNNYSFSFVENRVYRIFYHHIASI